MGFLVAPRRPGGSPGFPDPWRASILPRNPLGWPTKVETRTVNGRHDGVLAWIDIPPSEAQLPGLHLERFIRRSDSTLHHSRCDRWSRNHVPRRSIGCPTWHPYLQSSWTLSVHEYIYKQQRTVGWFVVDGYTVVDLHHGVSIFRLAGGQGILSAISSGLGDVGGLEDVQP